MKVFELLTSLTYWQNVKLIRVNDYGKKNILFEGTKRELVTNMDEEIFHQLANEVVAIENKEGEMVILYETKYFWSEEG